MTHTKSGAFVVCLKTGGFLKGKNAWNKSWTDDLGSARIYAKRHHAVNSMNHLGRYERDTAADMEVREVELILK